MAKRKKRPARKLPEKFSGLMIVRSVSIQPSPLKQFSFELESSGRQSIVNIRALGKIFSKGAAFRVTIETAQ